MTTTINYPFTTGSNYLFDTDKIEVTGGVVKLKLQSAQNDFTETFDSDSGFTYDSAKAEFTGGLVRQKDQRPANATFGVTYTANQNANWGDSFLNGTLRNLASVSAGKLNITTSTDCVEHYSPDNAKLGQTGCIRFKFAPTWSGAPGSSKYMFSYGGQSTPYKNKVNIYQSGAGAIYANIKDNTGADILNKNFGAWSPTAGVSYIFELNFDVTSGATRLFIDGAQLGSTDVSTGTRDFTDCVIFVIGNSINELYGATGTYDDVILFSTVQHTTNHTATYTIPETIYTETTVTMPEMEHTGDGSLISFDDFTTTEAGTPKYTLQIDRSGDYLYWNGSAWVASDGSYSQSTSKATFNTNRGSLAINGATYGQFKIHFGASVTVSSVSTLTATLTENDGYPTDDPTITTNSTFIATDLSAFSATEAITGSDNIKYTMVANGQDRWVTGGSAADSNGTYAESSTSAEIDSDIENITTARKTIYLKAFLHSDDGSTTPELDLVSIQYNAAAADATLPTLSELEGWIYDANEPVVGATVKIRPYQAGFMNQQIFHKYEWDTIGTTDADGFFFGNIFVQPSGHFWEFKVGSKRYKIAINNVAENYLWSLPTFEVIEDE